MISSPSGAEGEMIQFIQQKLEQIPGVYYSVDKMGNIYAVKGKSSTYPCVVAHTDEVHRRPITGYEVVAFREEIIVGYDSERKTFLGIGADDKNGIWVALKCLERYDVIKCVFFVDEERGCVGSSKAYMGFFKDCRFVLQCDRRGNSDIIVSIDGVELCSKEFLQAINHDKHGYKRAMGMMTDVFVLKRQGIKVSCINLSCGYYEPHTSREYTIFADLQKSLVFVCNIIETCTQVYQHKYKKPKRVKKPRYYDWRELDDYRIPFEKKGCKKETIETRKHEYENMFSQMTRIVKHFPTMGIDLLITSLKSMYPQLNYRDYQKAYSDITNTPVKESSDVK